mgnify:CR=1 FL=1
MSGGRGLGPLAGVKVLDLTSVLMGPYATQIFADLGADVIKIEGPAGDTTRHLPPGPEAGRGAMFVNLNRGKKCLALDLKQPAARDVVLRMSEQADVFVHSMRAAAIKRLGLHYEALKARNLRLVYANLYGFGAKGRYADYPAYDDIVQAASGLTDLQASLNGGTPAYLATVVADKVAGLTGAYAIIAALFAREKNGAGQEIEVPMFETLVSFMYAEHLGGSLYDPPLGPPAYPRVVAKERHPYRTRDGYLALMIYTDRHWRAFFDAIGNPAWSTDPRGGGAHDRGDGPRPRSGRVDRRADPPHWCRAWPPVRHPQGSHLGRMDGVISANRSARYAGHEPDRFAERPTSSGSGFLGRARHRRRPFAFSRNPDRFLCNPWGYRRACADAWRGQCGGARRIWFRRQ